MSKAVRVGHDRETTPGVLRRPVPDSGVTLVDDVIGAPLVPVEDQRTFDGADMTVGWVGGVCVM